MLDARIARAATHADRRGFCPHGRRGTFDNLPLTCVGACTSIDGVRQERKDRWENEMGACNFISFGVGKTAADAFHNLVDEATWEYGHDPYNGTISTTQMSRRAPKVVQKNWGPRAQRAAIKVAESDGWGEKREARVIDCGRTKGGHMWAFYGWAAC